MEDINAGEDDMIDYMLDAVEDNGRRGEEPEKSEANVASPNPKLCSRRSKYIFSPMLLCLNLS